MGIIGCCWRFEASTEIPSRADVVAEMSAGIGIELCEAEGAFSIYELRGWAIYVAAFDERVECMSFLPPHPYLMENLDAALLRLGGIRVADAISWTPNPRHAHLRTPWASLSKLQRLILKLPGLGVSRPFDRFL